MLSEAVVDESVLQHFSKARAEAERRLNAAIESLELLQSKRARYSPALPGERRWFGPLSLAESPEQ